MLGAGAHTVTGSPAMATDADAAAESAEDSVPTADAAVAAARTHEASMIIVTQHTSARTTR
jgi:hypothetical protein